MVIPTRLVTRRQAHLRQLAQDLLDTTVGLKKQDPARVAEYVRKVRARSRKLVSWTMS